MPVDEDDEVMEIEDVPPPSAVPHEDAPVVLVVDDDPDIRTLLVRVLGTKYTVYAASDGNEARTMLATIPLPAAMVCDVMVPHVDGLTLAKEARSDPMLKQMPILLLSAKSGPLDVIAGINAGARHYLTKPFKMQELLEKVAAMIEKQRR